MCHHVWVKVAHSKHYSIEEEIESQWGQISQPVRMMVALGTHPSGFAEFMVTQS
jgi:hypothetical protein